LRKIISDYKKGITSIQTKNSAERVNIDEFLDSDSIAKRPPAHHLHPTPPVIAPLTPTTSHPERCEDNFFQRFDAVFGVFQSISLQKEALFLSES
jgi:hypothetical protein